MIATGSLRPAGFALAFGPLRNGPNRTGPGKSLGFKGIGAFLEMSRRRTIAIELIE